MDTLETEGEGKRGQGDWSQVGRGEGDIALQALRGPDNTALAHLWTGGGPEEGKGLATQWMPWVNDSDGRLGAYGLSERGSYMGWVSQSRWGPL